MELSTAAAPMTVLRRLTQAAFAFFLIKGLLWLAAPFVFLWLAHA